MGTSKNVLPVWVVREAIDEEIDKDLLRLDRRTHTQRMFPPTTDA